MRALRMGRPYSPPEEVRRSIARMVIPAPNGGEEGWHYALGEARSALYWGLIPTDAHGNLVPLESLVGGNYTGVHLRCVHGEWQFRSWIEGYTLPELMEATRYMAERLHEQHLFRPMRDDPWCYAIRSTLGMSREWLEAEAALAIIARPAK